MSIVDGEGNELVRLPGFWNVMAKLAITLAVPTFGLGATWAIWITKQTFSNTQDIAVMKALNAKTVAISRP